MLREEMRPHTKHERLTLRRRGPFLSVLLSLCLSLVLTACASTQPVIKIGLVAPFEGRFRAIGYEAIYAARLAIREINARGGVNGYRIELVALDDRGEAERAIDAARQLIIDPQVVVVIGHYRPTTTAAALNEYCAGSYLQWRLKRLASTIRVRAGHCSSVAPKLIGGWMIDSRLSATCLIQIHYRQRRSL